jgi:peptidoglycan/xylan/chitin deacetylase (PgdA/CDA1 family)
MPGRVRRTLAASPRVTEDMTGGYRGDAGMWRRAIFCNLVLAGLACGISEAAAQVQRCADKTGGIGVGRIVEIDALAGPHYGQHTRSPKEPSFLRPKEVVLTFDDGPMPGLTRSILNTLDDFCTRATFFSVGRMAAAYPWLVRETLARGHTVGTHTWSHPLNMRRLRQELSTAEIERGFAAVALAAQQPIAPFFRFPGLNDSPAMLTYLQGRNIATFTVDVISDDSFIQSTERLIQTTLQRVEAHKGGILLFHDIKIRRRKRCHAFFPSFG